jgi:hypothetical protein
MTEFADFDRYREEHSIASEVAPDASRRTRR